MSLKVNNGNISSNEREPKFFVMKDLAVINPTRNFRIEGIIVNIYLQPTFTMLAINAIDSNWKEKNDERFSVYFFDNAKAFIDAHADKGYVVDVSGDMYVSFKEKTKGEIILKGLYASMYKVSTLTNVENPEVKYVSLNDVEQADNAF